MQKLRKLIAEKSCNICVGLDPFVELFPTELDTKNVGEAIIKFNRAIIEAVADIVPVVKPQIAFYEQYGTQGMQAFADACKYAKKQGLYVIADAKRGDIGSTAAGYAKAFLTDGGFDCDAVTVNGYLGTDGIKPFLDTGRDIFVLAKTSNPSGGELQSLTLESGEKVYEKMTELIHGWGENAGAVVGATYPSELAGVCEKYPDMMLLIPGYGAQGGTGADIAVARNQSVVNSSRGILYAEKDRAKSLDDFAAAAREAVVKMKEDLN